MNTAAGTDTSYEFKVELRDGFLHVRVTGQNSPRTVREYLSRLGEARERFQCPYVLLEEHLEGPGLGAGEVFEIVTSRGGKAAAGLRAIAFVDTNKAHSSATMEFAENVAVNRGMNVRVFGEVSAAEAWLRAYMSTGQLATQ